MTNRQNKYCIEVNNYADTHMTNKIFTQKKTNNLIQRWRKIHIQAMSGDQEPLLFFSYNRSKVFVVCADQPKNLDKYMHINWLGCYVMLADAWLKIENPEFIKNGYNF